MLRPVIFSSLFAMLSLSTQAMPCEDLLDSVIPAEDITLSTRGAVVDSAELMSAMGNASMDVCRVRGHISPATLHGFDINFQVNLPLQWNGNSLHFGGGGLNGVLVEATGHYTAQPKTEPTPLQMGLVTYGSDSGHVGHKNFDGSFYLFDEALRNFGHEQLKKTHDVAEALILNFYGRAPEYRYFIGGSQGGHEAFDVVQRYPDDYDGVIAGYPAHNVVMLHLSANQYARALIAHDGAGWLNPNKVKAFTSKVYETCDGLDGAKDGIISHVAACRLATQGFKLLDESNPIRCPQGEDSAETCLSDAQISALNVQDERYDLGFSVFADDVGTSQFAKWTPFEGSTFFDGNFPNLGAQNPRQALQALPGDVTLRYAIAGDLSLDPLVAFDPKKYAKRIADVVEIMSANSVNIDAFRARGGKLIFFHGRVDDFIPVYSSIDYWQRLQQRYADALGDFVKFYVVPGMGHISGPFKARMSSFDALQQWVESGKVPGNLQAIDENDATAGRTRPVCHYPLWPQYKASGDINHASSFVCVAD